MSRLSNLLLQSLTKFASPRTMKYEMSPADKEAEKLKQKSIDVSSPVSADFQESVNRIVNTIELLAAAEGTSVLVDGSFYAISDYTVPVFAQGIIDAGHVYLNDRAAHVANELYHVECQDPNDVLTPAEFNGFWIRYNSAQPDEFKFNVNPVRKADFHTLSEVEIAKMEDGTYGELGGSVIPGQVAQILEISVPFKGLLKQVPMYSEKELVEWLKQ